MKIGLAIAMQREKLGMTQEELAKAVDVSKATISRWESGDISNMRRDRILSLRLFQNSAFSLFSRCFVDFVSYNM